MKILKITIPIIIMIIFATSCIKRKNCDCAKEGKFVYFKEPLQVEPAPHGNPDVNAIFYPKDSEYFYYIQDYIPIKFRTNDTISVSICLEKKYRGLDTDDIHFCPYKIKCIEKIE